MPPLLNLEYTPNFAWHKPLWPSSLLTYCLMLACSTIIQSCIVCDSSSCSQGFTLVASTESGAMLPAGVYQFNIIADSQELHGECQINDAIPVHKSCTVSSIPENTKAFHLNLVTDGPPPKGFLVNIQRRYQKDEASHYEAPKQTFLSLLYEGQVVAESLFTPTYRRYEYRGKGCGWCEELPEPLKMIIPGI